MLIKNYISVFRPKQQSLRQRSLEQYRSSREAVSTGSSSSREAAMNLSSENSNSSREAHYTGSDGREIPFSSSSLQSLHKYQVNNLFEEKLKMTGKTVFLIKIVVVSACQTYFWT